MTTRFLIAATTMLALAQTAWAGSTDFVLHRFRTCTVQPCTAGIVYTRPYDPASTEVNPIKRVIPDEEAFGKFVKELGIALAPRYLEPAETLGQAGFSMGVGMAMTDIKGDQSYWVDALPDPYVSNKPEALTTLLMQGRKGLPFSFELGGSLTHLVGSQTFLLGADVKWALNEGFLFLPDIAVRGSVNRLVGHKQLDMLLGGADVSISHPIPIGGMVVITPYAGWNLLFINASSHVLDATPGLDGFPPPHCVADDPDPNSDPVIGADRRNPGEQTPECLRAAEGYASRDLHANFVLPQQDTRVNRFFGGLRVQLTILNLVAEGSFGDGISSFASKLELDF